MARFTCEKRKILMKRKCMRIFSIWMVLCLFLSGFASVPCKAAPSSMVMTLNNEEQEGELGDEVNDPVSIEFLVKDGEQDVYYAAEELPGTGLEAGASLQLTPYILYENGEHSNKYNSDDITYRFETSDEAVATVDTTGLIKTENVTTDSEVDITVTAERVLEDGSKEEIQII